MSISDKHIKTAVCRKEAKVRLHPRSVVLDGGGQAGGGDIRPSRDGNNSSALKDLPSEWVVFDEMTKAGRLSLIKGVTVVSPLTVALFAGPNRLRADDVDAADANYVKANVYLEETSDSDEQDEEGEKTAELRIDDWTMFTADRATIDTGKPLLH